jgi:hypothetical protein
MRHLVIALLALACGTAFAMEREVASVLSQQTEVADELGREILAMVETAPDAERLELYRTYNRLMGAWTQVQLSQALLEERSTTMLRDQVPFALWELDNAREEIEHEIVESTLRYAVFSEAVSTLLSDARHAIVALCAQVRCASDAR